MSKSFAKSVRRCNRSKRFSFCSFFLSTESCWLCSKLAWSSLQIINRAKMQYFHFHNEIRRGGWAGLKGILFNFGPVFLTFRAKVDEIRNCSASSSSLRLDYVSPFSFLACQRRIILLDCGLHEEDGSWSIYLLSRHEEDRSICSRSCPFWFCFFSRHFGWKN